MHLWTGITCLSAFSILYFPFASLFSVVSVFFWALGSMRVRRNAARSWTQMGQDKYRRHSDFDIIFSEFSYMTIFSICETASYNFSNDPAHIKNNRLVFAPKLPRTL